ncbi:MAG: DUF1232 domain-containing protein [Victivallales bacterium]|nr:DUF1232 domain-containing protein [Victivallales bacterium]
MMNEEYQKDYSHEKLWDKLRRNISKIGKKALFQILTLYVILCREDTPMLVKTSIIAALGYLICPFDLIPDFLPGGFVDDLLAISILLAELSIYQTESVKDEVRELMDEWNFMP